MSQGQVGGRTARLTRLRRSPLVPAVLVLALTSWHHMYGAERFQTPWRAHVAHLAAWTAIGLIVIEALQVVVAAAALRRVQAVVVLAVPVLWIGMYEGAYGHVMKVVVHAVVGAGAGYDRLFPSPPYELPVDLLFELSGVAQVPLAVWAGVVAFRALRSRAA